MQVRFHSDNRYWALHIIYKKKKEKIKRKKNKKVLFIASEKVNQGFEVSAW